MKILHFASEYPPQKIFGLGRFVRDLAEEQARQGHSVTVLTNSMGGKHPDTEVHGVRVLRIDHPPPPEPPNTSGCLMVFNTLLLKRALDIGTSELSKFDVFCSHDWLTAPAAQACHERFGPPHLCTFHDTIWGKRLGRPIDGYGRFAAQAESWIAKKATQLIANSKATRQELLTHYGADPKRISVVPCAIAPKTFAVTGENERLQALKDSLALPNEIVFLYVGRLDTEKGVEHLLNAFGNGKLPNGRLWIVGTGQLQEKLIATVRERGLREKVDFLGYVENPVLAHLYACADVLVCPSLYEPFGMVALEGMLQGKPVIASRTGGLPEFVEQDQNGLLVTPGNETELKAALERLYGDAKARLRLGAQARQDVVDRHTWEIAAKATTEVYAQVTDRRCNPKTSIARRVFVGAGANSAGFRRGRLARSTFEAMVVQDPSLGLVTTLPEENFPLDGLDREDQKVLDGFLMAAQLLQFSECGSLELICLDWSAVFGASVLTSKARQTAITFLLPLSAQPDEGISKRIAYETEMAAWAASRAQSVLVPSGSANRTSSWPFKVHGSWAIPTTEPAMAPVTDPNLFRRTFAQDSEFLAVTALRLVQPLEIGLIAEVCRCAGKAGVALRWVVCGEGQLKEDLEALASRECLPIVCLGYLPERLCGALLNGADVAIVPFSEPLKSAFIEEALAVGKPVLGPQGTDALYPSGRIKIFEFSPHHPENLVQEIRKLSGKSTPPKQEKMADQQSILTREYVRNSDNSELVLFNDWGLGDELLLSAVARELKQSHPELKLWIRSRYGFQFPSFCERGAVPSSARWVETIYQNPVLYGPQNHSPFPGHLVQQMLDKIALETGIKVQARDLRPEVALSDLQAQRDLRAIVLHSRPNKRLPSKDWGLERWQTLARILAGKGFKLWQAGGPDEPVLPFAESYCGLSPGDVPQLVAKAGMVVTLVGFLMHVAAATRTPALVLYGGREHPAIDGYPDQVHLCSESLACRGRWGCHLAPDSECPHGLKCMNELEPELVAEMVQLALQSRQEGR